MADGQGPARTKRRLRFVLRGMREELDIPQSDVVKKLDWSLSKLVRIENGSVGISVTDLRALLGVYRAPEDTVEDLVNLARTARERRWWSKYRDILTPQYQEFIAFEAEASRLRQFHPTIVPGLLQIEPYIRALLPALVLSPLSQSHYDSLIEVRLRRQEEILHGDNPTEFKVVIDEAALRRPVGGVEVMRQQLDYIAETSTRDLVSVAVLPFSAGPHVGMVGAFHLMDFAADDDDTMLYLENAFASVSLRDRPDVIDQYGKQLDQMVRMSLRGEAAAAYVRKIADELV